jgi:hypothetical protein
VTKIGALGTTQADEGGARFLRNVVSTRATRRNNPEDTILHRIVPSSPILVTLMKEVLSSSKTSGLTRATRRNIPEDAILPNLRVYITIYIFCEPVRNARILKHFLEMTNSRWCILAKTVKEAIRYYSVMVHALPTQIYFILLLPLYFLCFFIRIGCFVRFTLALGWEQ